MSDLLGKEMAAVPTKKSSKRLLAMIGIGAIPLGIGICFIQVPIGCACGNPDISTTGHYVRAQAYHISEYQTFTKSYESIGIPPIPEKTKRYSFSTEVTSDRFYIYATPRAVPTDLFRLGLTKAEISPLVGAVAYDRKQKTTDSILCIAEQGSFDKPPKPIFNGGKFTCPSGFYAR